MRDGQVHVLGRMPGASNETLLCAVEHRGRAARAVLKTRRGERPLRDFPVGTLSHREVAAFVLSHVLGIDAVPPTVWRTDLDGSLQAYVEQDPAHDPVVSLVETESEVALAHSGTEAVRSIAFLDILMDNADRKGGHILTGACLGAAGPAHDGGPALRGTFAIDNGLSFNTHPTLRTVLWGFAGSPLTAQERGWAERAAAGEGVDALEPHLDAAEIAALQARARTILAAGEMPQPPHDRWAVPWPVL